MKILVVGAGAIGGYFGGRLVEKGMDVTFLVRENRKQQIRENGFKINSIHGNIEFMPKLILTGEEVQPFDVILVSTKSYHLSGVLKDITPYVGEETMILPLLNGISHLETLQNYFGEDKVLGGLCFIETTLDQNGYIIQTSSIHDLVFGEVSNEKTKRILKLNDAFSGTKTTFRSSDHILKEMWHKYIFITTFSGVTTLMRSPIGPIRETIGGQEFISKLIHELASVARKLHAPISTSVESKTLATIINLNEQMKSSMQRDMEKGLPVEADHLQGYFYEKAKHHEIEVPMLQVVYGNLKVYESYSLS